LNAASHTIDQRVENAKLSSSHVKIIGLVGAATFFDAFDALSIAYVLPILAGIWALTPPQIGLTISIGYVGQMVGALALGWVAERRGRIFALRWSVGLLSVLSLFCAFAWSLPILMLGRLLQGVGLGGEVPIAATYVNEWCPSRLRGRLVFLFQSLFAGGVAITSLVAAVVIPVWGWRGLFALGAAPALLFLALGRTLPESPRWLASRGRNREAAAVLDKIDGTAPGPALVGSETTGDAPPQATFADLFAKGYAGRTLTAWLILICTAGVGYGLLTWLPTLYRTVYHLSVADTFRYSFLNNFVGLFGAIAGATVIDRLGRKASFAGSFVGAAIPLLVLWALGRALQPVQVMGLTTVACFFISVMLAGIYVYTPEIYPTRMRAIGTATATAWYRLASIVSPITVGLLLVRANVDAVYLFFALLALIGAVVVAVFAVETRGKTLEEIAA
jgi:putative MFS transporter